jgi:hypothetical protein
MKPMGSKSGRTLSMFVALAVFHEPMLALKVVAP